MSSYDGMEEAAWSVLVEDMYVLMKSRGARNPAQKPSVSLAISVHSPMQWTTSSSGKDGSLVVDTGCEGSARAGRSQSDIVCSLPGQDGFRTH